MIRLTFVGDVALDKPLLKAAKIRGNGKYDFSDVFHTQDVFSKSNLVIGNLETVFGGGRKYNKKPYHYNSPDAFCDAIKDAGIGLVSTANNHCMDEGVAGLQRTRQILDQRNILHTGTFLGDEKDRFLIKEMDGLKVGFYSLTYSVNEGMEAFACSDLYGNVNLIGFTKKRPSLTKRFYKFVILRKLKQFKKKIKKQATISAHQDKYDEKKINKKWMADIENEILKAKEKSDVLVVLLHIGGQFNVEPGDYSKFMMDKLCDLGADVIIGNHPHTIQRIENRAGRIVAYSLGGYCMSVSGEYLVRDCLPEYSLALHVDIDEETRRFETSFDVLKATEDKEKYLRVAKAEEGDPGLTEIKKRCQPQKGNNDEDYSVRR